MVPEVASELAQLGQRDDFVGDDRLVFPGDCERYLDGSTLRRRFVAATARAGLRPIRFHEYADIRVMPTLGRKPAGRLLPMLKTLLSTSLELLRASRSGARECLEHSGSISARESRHAALAGLRSV